MTVELTAEQAREKSKKLYIDSKGHRSLAEISRMVGRDRRQIVRWRDADNWNEHLADDAINEITGFDQEESIRVLDSIDWGSPNPLQMDEINEIMTVIYKGFLRQLLEKTIHGGITITNFYQADQFIARIEGIIRRLQGEPDQKIEHTHVTDRVPGADSDDKQIMQGMKRLKELARQRRLRGLQAEEDTVITELIKDKDTVFDQEDDDVEE